MIYSKHMTINSYAQVTYKYNTKQKVNCEKWVQGFLIEKTNLEDTQTDRQTDRQKLYFNSDWQSSYEY